MEYDASCSPSAPPLYVHDQLEYVLYNPDKAIERIYEKIKLLAPKSIRLANMKERIIWAIQSPTPRSPSLRKVATGGYLGDEDDVLRELEGFLEILYYA